MKLVINADYGGFSVSLEAARFMAARGNQTAIKELTEFEYYLSHPDDPKLHGFIPRWYGYDFYDDDKRNDPDLVAAVEELGSDKASGGHASLKVVEIPDGIPYTIEEYDGLEHVAEQHRKWY